MGDQPVTMSRLQSRTMQPKVRTVRATAAVVATAAAATFAADSGNGAGQVMIASGDHAAGTRQQLRDERSSQTAQKRGAVSHGAPPAVRRCGW